MNDFIVETWNSTVKPEDRVIVVGDLSASLKGRYSDFAAIIGKLQGRKTLIRGNHDHQPDSWYISAGFESVTDWLLEDGILFVHKPATQFNTETMRICENLDFELIVHGHIHDTRPDLPGHFNVAWDRFRRLIDIREVKGDD
jgi:calcineurin-like phosphoesterase family protein